MSEPARSAERRAGSARRADWRPGPKPAAGRASKTPALAGWTLASLAAVAGIVAVIYYVFVTPRVAVVQLVIDEYEIGLVAPVPFAPEDARGIERAVAGRISPRFDKERGAIALTAYQTKEGIATKLGDFLKDMKLGRRDTLIAVVRGQTLVRWTDSAAEACLLPEDAKLDRGRAAPANALPCRALFEAVAGSRAGRTLVVFDMGDLRWDPRLGVAAGIVPAVLDTECRRPLESGAGECWVLGSHDVHEFSGVSLADRRGYFLRAVELALEGRADDRQWGGDGSGSVGLHELARFVAAWTSRWASAESGGVFDQRPVLWRLGTGRMPLAAAPQRDAAIIHAGRVGADRKRPLPKAQIGGGPAAAAPATTAPQPPQAGAGAPATPPTADALNAGSSAASPAGQPTGGAAAAGAAAGAPAAATVLWETIEGIDGGGNAAAPSPLEYAPHVWRRTVALAAAVWATPRDGSSQSDRAVRLEGRLEAELGRFRAGGRGGERFDARDTPVAALAAARLRAEAEMLPAWRTADETVRQAVAARNRGLELASAGVQYFGLAAGSDRVRRLGISLPKLLDALAAVHREILKLSAANDAAAAALLVDLTAAAAAAEREVRSDVNTATDDLIRRIERDRDALQAAEIRWLAGSRLLDARQRRLLAAALEARIPRGGGAEKRNAAETKSPPANQRDPADADTSKDSAAAADDEAGRRLKLVLPAARVPADVSQANARRQDTASWRGVQDRLRLKLQLMTFFRPAGQSAAGDDPDAPLRTGIEAITAAGGEGGGDPVTATTRAGDALASRLARMPAEIEAMRPRETAAARSGESAMQVDALLRLADPRDIVNDDVLGWMPKAILDSPFRVAVRCGVDRLELGRPQRVEIGLASGAALPADGTIALDFDRSRLKVWRVAGEEIGPRAPLQLSTLDDRTGLVLMVEPRRAIPVGEAARSADFRVELRSAGRFEEGRKRFDLPLIERLAVLVRGRRGTVDDADDPDGGWRRVSVDPLAAPADAADVPDDVPLAGEIRLRPFPGQITSWDIELLNQTGENRAVEVEIVSISSDAAVGPADARDAARTAWSRFARSVERRRPLPAIASVVSTATGPVALPAGEERVSLHLSAPRGAAGNPPPDAEKKPAAVALASTLALVIRDAGDPPSAKAGGADAAATASARPPERRRIWVVRLPLVPRRPWDYLSARAVWSDADRSIAVTVEPLDQRLLPDAVVQLEAAQPPGGADNARHMQLRLARATLAAGTPPATLQGVWNGPADASAELAVGVDGYPRAFVFTVKCTAAMNGVRQSPAGNWARLAFLAPKDQQPFPVAAPVPVRLAVDLPRDMLGAGRTLVDLVLREKPVPPGGKSPSPKWASDEDRRASFTLADAPDAALAVRCGVDDWDVVLDAPGFNNVDALLEATVRLPNDKRTESRSVVFDGAKPAVQIRRSRVQAEKGKVATIELECDDGGPAGASGVVGVEWCLDADRNGMSDDGKWRQINSDPAGAISVGIPTDGLDFGRHSVLVRVVDGVKLRSEARECEIEIVP
jgi:hypothetical protein